VVHPFLLGKSMTLWWLIGRQGIPSQMRWHSKEKDTLKRTPGERVERRSTNRMSPTSTTPRSSVAYELQPEET